MSVLRLVALVLFAGVACGLPSAPTVLATADLPIATPTATPAPTDEATPTATRTSHPDPTPTATATADPCPDRVTLRWGSIHPGQELQHHGTIDLQCVPLDNAWHPCFGGIRYSANGALLADTAPPSYIFTWNMTTVPVGAVHLACIALDLEGHEYSDPAPITVDVQFPDDEPPCPPSTWCTPPTPTAAPTP